MNEHTKRLIDRISDAYQRFQKSIISLPELQNTVEGTLGAIEAADDVSSALKWFAAELETVRFMFPEDEHPLEIQKRMVQFQADISK